MGIPSVVGHLAVTRPKGVRTVMWPDLDDAQRQELDNRLTIIDCARDTINARRKSWGRGNWRSARWTAV